MIITTPLALAALVALAAPPPLPDVETGDVIFQTSTSPQAPAIMSASKSPYSHVGVIVVEKGKPFVIEAQARVAKTPLDRFVARGVGGAYTILRAPGLDDEQRATLAKEAKKLVGRPYDIMFLRGPDKIYCSELVRIVYDAVGVEVGAWEKAGELDLDAKPVRALLEKRWRKHPTCAGLKSAAACIAKVKEQDIITPASLANDTRLVKVASTYP